MILAVTLLDFKCDFSVLSLSHCVTFYSSSWDWGILYCREWICRDDGGVLLWSVSWILS